MTTDIIAAYLAACQFGAVGSTIFADLMPERPDDAVSVQMSGSGMSPTWVQDRRGPETERPAVQVMVRSRSVATAKATAQSIYTALSGVTNLTLDGVRILRIVPMQSPFPLMLDDNARHVWVVNFTIEKEVG